MKIQLTCSGCQTVLKVKAEHVGKRCKCPACGHLNLISDNSVAAPSIQAPPTAPTPGYQQPAPQQSGYQQPSSPFANPNSAPIDFTTPANSPYQAPQSTAPLRPLNTKPADIPGIMGVVCGGVSLLFLVLGICLSPLWILAILGAIAGLITSFFGKPPLKAIGISLNAVALVLCVMLTVAIVGLFMYISTQAPGGGPW